MHQRGFSLLEAIVALAILASAGLALFAALGQSVQMVGRAERAQQLELVLRNGLAWMEQVNPMEEPQGELRIGDHILRWQAEPLEPPRDNQTGTIQPGLFEVGLYRVRLEVWREGALELETGVNRIGYRQVRDPVLL